MFTLYAPGSIQISMASLTAFQSMLIIPALAEYVPANVLSNPNLAVERSDVANSDTPVFTTIRLDFDGVKPIDVPQLHDNIVTWAKRCRIPGVRGTRLAVVATPDMVGTTVQVVVQLGTTVFYNARRVTLGVSLTDTELLSDVENLLPHVPFAPSVYRLADDGSAQEVVEPDATIGIFAIDLVDAPERDPIALLTELRVAVAMLNAQDDTEVLINELDNVQSKLDAFRAAI